MGSMTGSVVRGPPMGRENCAIFLAELIGPHCSPVLLEILNYAFSLISRVVHGAAAPPQAPRASLYGGQKGPRGGSRLGIVPARLWKGPSEAPRPHTAEMKASLTPEECRSPLGDTHEEGPSENSVEAFFSELARLMLQGPQGGAAQAAAAQAAAARGLWDYDLGSILSDFLRLTDEGLIEMEHADDRGLEGSPIPSLSPDDGSPEGGPLGSKSPRSRRRGDAAHTMNFSQAALLIERSTAVWGTRIESLHAMAFNLLHHAQQQQQQQACRRLTEDLGGPPLTLQQLRQKTLRQLGSAPCLLMPEAPPALRQEGPPPGPQGTKAPDIIRLPAILRGPSAPPFPEKAKNQSAEDGGSEKRLCSAVAMPQAPDEGPRMAYNELRGLQVTILRVHRETGALLATASDAAAYNALAREADRHQERPKEGLVTVSPAEGLPYAEAGSAGTWEESADVFEECEARATPPPHPEEGPKGAPSSAKDSRNGFSPVTATSSGALQTDQGEGFGRSPRQQLNEPDCWVRELLREGQGAPPHEKSCGAPGGPLVSLGIPEIRAVLGLPEDSGPQEAPAEGLIKTRPLEGCALFDALMSLPSTCEDPRETQGPQGGVVCRAPPPSILEAPEENSLLQVPGGPLMFHRASTREGQEALLRGLWGAIPTREIPHSGGVASANSKGAPPCCATLPGYPKIRLPGAPHARLLWRQLCPPLLDRHLQQQQQQPQRLQWLQRWQWADDLLLLRLREHLSARKQVVRMQAMAAARAEAPAPTDRGLMEVVVIAEVVVVVGASFVAPIRFLCPSAAAAETAAAERAAAATAAAQAEAAAAEESLAVLGSCERGEDEAMADNFGEDAWECGELRLSATEAAAIQEEICKAQQHRMAELNAAAAAARRSSKGEGGGLPTAAADEELAIQMRVARWNAYVEDRLLTLQSLPSFDIRAYETSLLREALLLQQKQQQSQEREVRREAEIDDPEIGPRALPDVVRHPQESSPSASLESPNPSSDSGSGARTSSPTATFASLVQGKPRYEVCRAFLTTLLLTNARKVSILQETEEDSRKW
ncbi:uncharacterized protein LOC34621448 [Cyclospora cayetanensis]|uniref:Uncharacterized protein LOC34621448 n=1 Tax=Cyclospora cayetanensis TaxID=88456 RepID=A0A6P6RQZ3_9EIME|nr:uncharacterized protein LOC34621448 [Cyclospora cayetanensis]